MWTKTTLGIAELLSGLTARLRAEEGQTMAEYALILALIIVVTVAVIVFLGGSISSLFTGVSNSL